MENLNTIPTAEEFLNNFNKEECNIDKIYYDSYVRKIMIEFTKLHVEKALKEANKKVTCREETQYDEYDNAILIAKINSDSILNAYPPENIK